MGDGAAVLITGAGGFTGRHASRRFAAKGFKVFALVRSEAGLPSIEGVQYLVCDLTDKAGVKRIIDRIRPQYVLHLGGKNSVPDSWAEPLLYIESNVMTTLYLLDALQAFGLGDTRILVAGSRLKFGLESPIYPTHPYGLSKSLQEAAALAWGKLFRLGVMIAEPGNLIGAGPSTGICSLLARHIVRLERGESPPPFLLSRRTPGAISSTCAMRWTLMNCCCAKARWARCTRFARGGNGAWPSWRRISRS